MTFQLELPKTMENLSKVLKVVLESIAPIAYVINVASRVTKSCQNSVHGTLEEWWCILESIWYDIPFVQLTVSSPKCSFAFVRFSDRDIVVSLS